MREWNTVEKGIQYLRETAMVETLYVPTFIRNDPCQGHDPEKVKSTPDIWQKLTRTALEKYASTLVVTFDRYEDLNRRPPQFLN